MRIYYSLLWMLVLLFVLSCNSNTRMENGSTANNRSNAKSQAPSCLVGNGFSYSKTIARTDDTLFSFGVEVTLPMILSEAPSAKKLNSKMESDFKQTIASRVGESQLDSAYFFKIGYEFYVEDTLLSILITEQEAWHLSEGLIRIAVYHYDCKNDKILTTNNRLSSWGMSMVPLIEAIVEKAHAEGDPDVPDFDEEWIRRINANIDSLKIYKNNKGQFVVIYPLRENPAVDGECVVSDNS